MMRFAEAVMSIPSFYHLIPQPDASWGNMLKAAMDQPNELLNQPWLIAPDFPVFATIFCFNSIGDVLRDVLDPKLQGRH
jgi:ABC-type dipeptide/oligopeptide/nickel transport system permease subunit